MSFTIRKPDGREHQIVGYKFSAEKLGSSKVASSKYKASELPKKVDYLIEVW